MNIESTRSKTKSFTRPFVVIDQHPENQHDFSRKKALPGERLYEDAPNETESKDNSKQSNKLIIFVDSIPPEIKVSGINYYLKFSEAKFKCIPGASAHGMKFYGELTLETNYFKVVLLHVGVNDILKNIPRPGIENLILNITMIIDKCKSFGIKKFNISGLIFNRKAERSILKQVNYELLQLSVKNEYHFIGNSSISNTVRMVHLCRDGLHLNNYAKDELAQFYR